MYFLLTLIYVIIKTAHIMSLISKLQDCEPILLIFSWHTKGEKIPNYISVFSFEIGNSRDISERVLIAIEQRRFHVHSFIIFFTPAQKKHEFWTKRNQENSRSYKKL